LDLFRVYVVCVSSPSNVYLDRLCGPEALISGFVKD